MSKNYEGICKTCHKYYKGRGEYFCSNHCRVIWTNTYHNVAKRDDVRKKISESRKGKPTISGEVHWNWKGKKAEKLFCKDCGVQLKTIPYGNKIHTKYCRSCARKHAPPLTPETRKRIGEAHKGKKLPHTPEWNHKISLANKKVNRTWLFGAKKSPETINKLKKSQKLWWLNPNNAKRRFEQMGHKPTKPEKYLMEFLQTHFPDEWKYTGNGKFWIEGKNPDFINCNGRKLIIEFDGIYWHKGRTQQDVYRNLIYAKYGYSVLSLNETDLNYGEEHLKKKVRELYDNCR